MILLAVVRLFITVFISYFFLYFFGYRKTTLKIFTGEILDALHLKNVNYYFNNTAFTHGIKNAQNFQ